MLTTSNKYSEIFLEKRRLLLDSCILNDWATDDKTKSVLLEIEKDYFFVFCNISMLEVGFGPADKADAGQIEIARSIYHSEGLVQVDNIELAKMLAFNQPVLPNTRFAYNPNQQEFYAARTNLIKLMEMRGVGGKRVRELSNDALIYYCAWNSRSSIITNNINDFKIFNELSALTRADHLVPIFSINDLELSLSQVVSFPENIK